MNSSTCLGRLQKPLEGIVNMIQLGKSRGCPRPTEIHTLSLLFIGALAALLVPQRAVGAPQNMPVQPSNTFVILLSGPYKPVPEQPLASCNNFGLTQVNVCDGTFAQNKIYPVSGLLPNGNGPASGSEGPQSLETQAQNAIGNFFVEFAGPHAAYDLPGGSITMLFTGQNLNAVPDGQGGTYIVGTIQLEITEATGAYASFLGGHNNMVDILHLLADGSAVEHCYCVISRPAPLAAEALPYPEGRDADVGPFSEYFA